MVETPFKVSPKCWKIGLRETLSNLFNSTLDLRYAVPRIAKMTVITIPANRKAGVMTVMRTTIVVTVIISLSTATNTHVVS